ncbi:MAG: nuclear transport factor 2 family protein [Pseudomonadota bacterium]
MGTAPGRTEPGEDGSSGTNVARLAACYEAWNETGGASLDRWAALMSPRFACLTLCEAVMEGNGTRSCGGREDALDYFRNCAEIFELIEHRIDRFIAEGERVVAIGRIKWRHRESGQLLDMEKLDVWEFEGGAATSFIEFYDTAYMRGSIGA